MDEIKQTEENPVKLVHKYLAEAKKYRKPFEKQWEEGERFYNGKNWRQDVQRPVKNIIFKIVETEVPIITDSRPGVSVVASKQEREEDAKVLDAAIEYTLQKQNINLILPGAVRQSLIGGPGYLYCGYDSDGDFGQGSTYIESLPDRFVYLDPSKSDLDEMKYVIIVRPVRIDDLKRQFPDKQDELKIVPFRLDSTNEEQDVILDPDRWHPGLLSSSSDRYATEDMTTLIEAYVKDYTLVSAEDDETTLEIGKEAQEFMNGENPDVHKYEDHPAHIKAHQMLVETINAQMTPENQEQAQMTLQMISDHLEMHEIFQKQNPKGLKPKYTNNTRMILLSGNVVIYDGDCPVNDGMYPIAPIYCYQDGTPYGFGEVKNLIPIQKSYDDLDYAEFKGLKLVSNPGWVKDDNSGVDETSLTNEEGIVVTKKQNTEVRRLEPGQISPQLSQRKQMDAQEMDVISGVNEASQGRQPTDVTAARAIRTLQQNAVGRMRLKTRMLEEYTMPRLGKLIASRIVRYWPDERMLRLYDANGKIKYVQFDRSKIEDLEYEIRSVPGSTAGLDKEAIYNLYKELLQMQAIDARAFFNAVDIPYKQKVLDYMDENDQVQAQLQQLAQENEQLKQIIGEAGGQLAAPAQSAPI